MESEEGTVDSEGAIMKGLSECNEVASRLTILS